MRTVVGLFASGSGARRAIEELATMGFAPAQISVVTNSASRAALESGAVPRLRSMSLADVGAVAASGPLADAAGTPNESLALGGLLQRFGFSPELARHYATGVARGETLESVTVEDADAERVISLMQRNASAAPRADVPAEPRAAAPAEPRAAAPAAPENEARRETRSENGAAAAGGIAASARSAARGTSPTNEPERTAEKREDGHVFSEDEQTIPVYREELRVGKREVERGAVRITTHVVEKPHTEQVVLREEHVEVERRPVDRLVQSGAPELKEKVIEIKEFAEEAVGAKQTRLVEEVVIHKRVVDRTATVGGNLRSTEVDVRLFDSDEYRRHFEGRKLGNATFDEHAPAYRLGEELRRPASPGRWEEVEPDARARWEAKRPGTWAEFKDAIRFAWSRERGKRR